MLKTLVASAILAAAIAALPMVSTEAATNIDINISKNRSISCGQGKRIVKSNDFVGVKARDCVNEVYVYTGMRYGKNYWIEVLRRNGKIISITRR